MKNTLRAVDFNAKITPLSGGASEGKWDWRVTVTRYTDGMTKTTKVSGGWTVAESYATKLAHELGMKPCARL